jgi:hypothetical protein
MRDSDFGDSQDACALPMFLLALFALLITFVGLVYLQWRETKISNSLIHEANLLVDKAMEFNRLAHRMVPSVELSIFTD